MQVGGGKSNKDTLSKGLNLVLIITLLATLVHCEGTKMHQAASRERIKRKISLLFHGPSAFTLIMGFGVPVDDLDYETVVAGYAFRISYQLPTKAEDTRPHYGVLHFDRKFTSAATNYTDNLSDPYYYRQLYYGLKSQSKYRWMFYKALEMLLEYFGYSGRACVLRSICEVAAVPFHFQNGILSDVLHLLMTPTSSKDILSSYTDNEYLHAEAVGHSGAHCQHIFKDCTKSILGHFSEIIDFSTIGDIIT